MNKKLIGEISSISHDTVLYGHDTSGKLVFFKSYDWKNEKEKALSDQETISEMGLTWRICSIDCLNLLEEKEEDDENEEDD